MSSPRTCCQMDEYVLPGRKPAELLLRRTGKTPVPTRASPLGISDTNPNFQRLIGIKRWRIVEGRGRNARWSDRKRKESVAVWIAESWMQACAGRLLTDLNVPTEEPSGDGNSRVGSIRGERETRNCGRNGRASASAGSRRGGGAQRSPEPRERIRSLAAGSERIWRSNDA
jgi:hypothetical protein